MNKMLRPENKQKIMHRSPFVLILLFLLAAISCTDKTVSFQIRNNVTDGPVQYGIKKLQDLAKEGTIRWKEADAQYTITTVLDDQMEEEGFAIKSLDKEITVTGGDAAGIMHGLLRLKEQLKKDHKKIDPISESPRFSFRAIKFNLPWDSYRNGPALELHTETCRDTLFWESFLDMMAENRFNKLTLWNLHPFNYLVKTKKYPEACGFSDKEMAEWETFWTTLFRMAKNRGIETYLINWNIFVSPEFAKAHNVAEYCIRGDYIVDQGDTSEVIKDYTRECVKEVIDKYPDLTGLGITLGEGMGGMTADEREEWLLESFVEGMRMASRKIKFIHRVPLSAGTGSGGSTNPYVEKMTRATLDTLSVAKSPTNIELKFNWSHPYSTTTLVKVHGGKLTDTYWNPPPTNYRLAWMMRNEDFFMLRWGQSDFIRNHIAKNGKPWVNGYYVGSECYIPAKDYITALPNTTHKYAFERQWMYYKQWGRLLFNPATPDAIFMDDFENRYDKYGETLFSAQQKVGKVPLVIASYWNATWDYTLYSEGMLSLMGNDKMKLISLPQLCDKKPLDPNYASIKEFLSPGVDGLSTKISPLAMADSLSNLCDQSLDQLKNIKAEENIDLLYELSDLRTWGHLGLYFSNKLRAAVAYQQFLDNHAKKDLRKSIEWLEKATEHWQQVVEITAPIYKPVPLQHYERNDHALFHWSAISPEVQEELNWLKALDK
jgi:hypothetical protein